MTGFNSYFVKLKRGESFFTAKVEEAGKGVTANFKQLQPGFFIAFFPVQAHFRFRDTLSLGPRRETGTVLLPALSKYNPRRLRKIGAMLENMEERDLAALIPQLLTVERFLEFGRLLDFFALSPADATRLLVRLEVECLVKVITYRDLLVTAHDHYQESLQALSRFLSHCQEQRLKVVPFATVEKALKIPKESFFFLYLVHSLAASLSFRVLRDAIAFQRLPNTEDEKKHMAVMEQALKKNRLAVFTIEDGIQVSGLEFAAVNDALWYMAEDGTIAQLDESHFIFQEELQKVVNRLKKFKRNQGDLIGIADAREMTGLSRKHILVLFGYFDTIGHTQRLGSKRKILLSA